MAKEANLTSMETTKAMNILEQEPKDMKKTHLDYTKITVTSMEMLQKSRAALKSMTTTMRLPSTRTWMTAIASKILWDYTVNMATDTMLVATSVPRTRSSMAK